MYACYYLIGEDKLA